MGNCTFNPKLTCFALYLKIVDTFLQNNVNTPQKLTPPNGDYNFQIICHIRNYITLLGVEFNNAHLDTSFPSIDPKIKNYA